MIAAVIIIGAGHAGVQVADSLRAEQYQGPITLVGDETCLPYQRPPLSKDFVVAEQPHPLPLRAESFYSDQGIDIRLGVSVVSIDPLRRTVTYDNGESQGYAHLVLATGARQRSLPGVDLSLPGIHVLRTVDDARRLRAELGDSTSALVVGAGFVGLEFAAAARRQGLEVRVIESADRALGRALSVGMSEHLVECHRRAGIKVDLDEGLDRLRVTSGGVTGLRTSAGRERRADLVVVGVGVVPNDTLAREAGLSVDNGIVVDQFLRTSRAGIYAVGDCANFIDARTGVRRRLESVQNAVDQGRHVAGSILGRRVPYEQVPLFWSNQGNMKLQVAGLAERDDDCVPIGDLGESKFSILRFRLGRLSAVESLNKPADHIAARRILASGVPPTVQEASEPGFTLKQHAQRLTPVG